LLISEVLLFFISTLNILLHCRQVIRTGHHYWTRRCWRCS